MRKPAGIVLGLLFSASLTLPAAAEEFGGTLGKINASNTIAIGHRDASIPFSYLDEDKRPVGYAMDLCGRVVDEVKRVLKKNDLRVSHMVVTAQNRIPLVASHAIDMECGSTTNTLSRQEQVDFSAIYFTTGTRVLARKSLNAREIEDFQGRSVAVVEGSTNERAIKAMKDTGKLRDLALVAFKDYSGAQTALEAGRVDAFATDDIVLFGLLAKSAMKGDLEVVGRFLTYDPYGIMMRRDDSAFRLVVNRTLAGLFRSGEIGKIHARWFDPLGVPVGALMKAGFELQALPE